MGSMAADVPTAAEAIEPKQEPLLDGYTSSSMSSPEPEHETSTQDNPAPPVKRKGGRKPIYATSEERKQRNRQAQAAFRERRTEYIKQLETTIQRHEETLHTLQQSHRNAADECLMLRYKNSLLERILLEKGIDVQAELRLKNSPQIGPVKNFGQQSPMQRAVLRQQQAQRNPGMHAPPIQTVNAVPQSQGQGVFSHSPAMQPTPPSQNSSPSAARSPHFALQGGMTSPVSDLQAQHPQQLQRPPSQQQRSSFPQTRPQIQSRSSSGIAQAQQSPTVPQPSGNYYPVSFQKHYDQLAQEYDAPADMLDDMEADDAEADAFIPNFRLPETSISISMAGDPAISHPSTTNGGQVGGGGLPVHGIDPFDPMLDADPFGLTASMHFPTNFAFEQTPIRR